MSDSNPAKDMAMQRGSVVVLKSGGPNMLVSGLYENSAVCVWLGDQEEDESPLRFDFFDRATLTVLVI